jgi:hypothetical protein
MSLYIPMDRRTLFCFISSALALIFSLTANGQQKDSLQLKDIHEERPQYLAPDLSLSNPFFLRSTQLNIIRQDSIRSQSPVILEQSLTTPLPSLSWSLENNLEIESMWKQEIARQGEYKTWKMILQSVQIGGVAYLAYLHFKKYHDRY